MPSDRMGEFQRALKMLRHGRFAEAALALEADDNRRLGRGRLPTAEALRADVLQRIGRNNDAESIATRTLKMSQRVPDVAARCHFVLGNICRERGDRVSEIKHLQIATTLAEADLELGCWAQLRLLGAFADFRGIEAAMGRLDEAKRVLARLGDPRPFAALHLWLAEWDTTRGFLDKARHQLGRAEALVSQGDDVWLRGYLAINSSVVSYYCADIVEAEKAAQLALTCAEASGHRATRRAANASLGHIHFSRGHLSRARERFDIALHCCEEGTINQLAIFDSIAQVALQSGDLEGCRHILNQVEALNVPKEQSKSKHYWNWALQTKIHLLLREGKKEHAREIIREIKPRLDEGPQSRIDTVTYLSAVETLIANHDLRSAANIAGATFLATGQTPPDLFAEVERVTARIVGAAGAPALAKVHLERAVRTFDTIGHAIGRSAASSEFEAFQSSPSELGSKLGSRKALDYVRALIDTRTQPELFGHEAISWLTELDCADTATISVAEGSKSPIVLAPAGTRSRAAIISLSLASTDNRNLTLSFTPRQDPVSIIVAFEFRRVIKGILGGLSPESPTDLEVIWAGNDWSSASGVVFAAESMLSVLKTVTKLAPADISVLITGETGVGKEIIAKHIHEQSKRAAMPFIALNCAAVPKDLLESQLFGYKKGSFSGASEPFQGVVRAANGGTLLLDEIGELPLEAQGKLLRFLEVGEVHPIGEAYPIKVNVRMLFATNSNLEQAVKNARFREDLFYRLNVVPIRIPPLRERREEIPLLVNVFSQRFGREFSKQPTKFMQSAMELLILYSWPGNVRQLSNEVRRLTALVEPGACVTPDVLSPEIVHHTDETGNPVAASPHVKISLGQTLEEAIAKLEREMVEHALKRANGHVVRAARTLGLSRKGLYLKRRRLGLAELNTPQFSN